MLATAPSVYLMTRWINGSGGHRLVAEGVGIQETPPCFTESLGAVGVDGAKRLALRHLIPHLDLQNYSPQPDLSAC